MGLLEQAPSENHSGGGVTREGAYAMSNSKVISEVRVAEIRWYNKHGKHPDRIVLDTSSIPYVIGDWSWNRLRPDREEFVEGEMKAACIYPAL